MKRIARIKAVAKRENVAAEVLETLIETYPGTIAPRADRPGPFKITTLKCPLDTPEKVVETLGIEALVDLQARRGIELDSDLDPENEVHVADVMNEARPYMEDHRAWVGLGTDGQEAGALCPVCDWERG